MTDAHDVLIDVLVVGAGPAGLAAARAAASHGAQVALVDLQARAGGQVWRPDVQRGIAPGLHRALAELERGVPVQWHLATQAFASAPGRLLIEQEQGLHELRYRSLVLATGARELLLPFPGWTLPGASGAGALQALVKQGWPIAGRRVLVAGSGPLLLAAAATLRAHGAQVLAICEQAPAASVRGFAARLWRWPAKLAQAAALRARLAGVPYRCGAWVRAAYGERKVSEVEIETARGVERIACDQLAVGYGLVPNLELARQLGCATVPHGRHAAVRVDARQATSVAGVYAAGEACGIGGIDCARVEGAIAGHHAAGFDDAARALYPRRQRARGFATLLPAHFTVRDEVRACATADTLVCRCEDVPLARLQGWADARAAKLATRCGMGSCQGRICGVALAELNAYPVSSDSAAGASLMRPPLFPTRLAELAQAGFSPADASASVASTSIASQGSTS
ncbi:FAD/NAD(P)-binding oxidoreductase [Lysobacter firmicutimachus]|uniref:FAD/NAD(P)-binding oxidoreductase n=1 Tax=Lysobacter firmicutimachus TaxID=1792846 RepID=A0AAU8MXJ8_9GAMM